MQNKISEADKLFNDDGTLRHRGWATSPILQYNREKISTSSLRTKEWEFYGAYEEDFGFEVFVADIGYMTLIGMVYHDFKKGKAYQWGGIKPFTLGKLGLSSEPNNGSLSLHNTLAGDISIEKTESYHRLIIDTPKFKKLKADITYKVDSADDAMVVVTGYETSKHFYYNYKKNMLEISGDISFNGETKTLNSDHATGNFDWGRGVWPYKTRWFWATGAGKVNGEKIWFNIGYGFGDLSTHTENMIFVDGKVHKTNKVEFHTKKKKSGEAWSFTSDDDRINLSLEPKTDCSGGFSVGFLKSSINQIHGLYYGTLVLDDGRKIELDGIHGHAEDISYLW